MKVYNFSAGPSCLPEEVLMDVQTELRNYNETGQSVMEMSHRSKPFESIINQTEKTLRNLMNIGDNYRILFLQGGASTQFSMIPLNLKKIGKAAYVNTGVWSKKAISEAKKYLTVDVVATGEDTGFLAIPTIGLIEGDYDYAHITLNNTIMGTLFNEIPLTGKRSDGSDIPLIADISSCVLSEPLDISKFALLYAGAQKNLAPAGVTLVIIREDLIQDSPFDLCPTMLQYKTHIENGSMYNTPPCWSIYVMGKVLAWVEKEGGAIGMKKRNTEKAQRFYSYLDESPYYKAPVEKGSRSLMNIPFLTKEVDDEKAKTLNKLFVQEAEKQGLVNLAGHRLVGGMRASIYNAMGLDAVEALITFMGKFAKEHLA